MPLEKSWGYRQQALFEPKATQQVEVVEDELERVCLLTSK